MDLNSRLGRASTSGADRLQPTACLIRAFVVWALVAAGVFVYESEFARRATAVPATVTQVEVVRAGRGRNGLVMARYREAGRDRTTRFRLWWRWGQYRPGRPVAVLLSDSMPPYVALDDPLYLHRWSVLTGGGLLLTLGMLPLVYWRMRRKATPQNRSEQPVPAGFR